VINLFPVDNVEVSVDKRLIEALHGDVRQGPRVEEFEKALGGWIGSSRILTTCSGTIALQLALRTAGIGSVNGGSNSDEVIVTPMTCAATIMPIIGAGARPVWADVDPYSGLLDPVDAQSMITENSRAIMCVHWGGTPCNMGALHTIGQNYGISIIEDAAHAFGAYDWNGVKIGNNSADYTMFSFQALKHLTTIDGGALSIRNEDDYKLAKLARWYGIDREGKHKDSRHEEDIEVWGLKWHMNDINAIIGLEQLKYADNILNNHRANAGLYWDALDGKRFIPAFPIEALEKSAFWLYTILMKDREDRLNFIRHMEEKEIRASQIHTRTDNHTVFREFKTRELPGVDRFSERMVCIPVHGKLTTLEKYTIIQACEDYAA
jgi:dTDP-4-amino-4,6-dideoxygalactose transaminase